MEIKHNSLKKPENSGASAQVLAALRAEKLHRTLSTIIKRHRAAKALAVSRMAAQVALDKLEARAAALASEVTCTNCHKRWRVTDSWATAVFFGPKDGDQWCGACNDTREVA